MNTIKLPLLFEIKDHQFATVGAILECFKNEELAEEKIKTMLETRLKNEYFNITVTVKKL